jgi:microsomal dipeptidase-like Zn-dependent dipeptidase
MNTPFTSLRRRSTRRIPAVPLVGWLAIHACATPPTVGTSENKQGTVTPTATAVTLADVPLTGAPVAGAAAIHEHVMAEHAFSGKWFWGSVDGPENVSMGLCDGNRNTHASPFGICSAASYLFGGKDKLGRDTCCHSGGIGDCNYKATNGNDPDAGDEFWDYLDWPIWDTQAHPRYWHGHLKKAFDAGLKLMVVQAVDNELLCTLTDRGVTDNPFRNGYHCTHGDSRESVLRQIDELEQFVANHSDFLEIAYSPAQARQIINDHRKMAIVIGVEAEYAWGNEREPIDLLHRMQDYYRHGARTAYLAHMVNTRLAGSAQYVDTLWPQQSFSNCFFLNKQCSDPDPAAPSDNPFRVTQSGLCPFADPAATYYDTCAPTLARGSDPLTWDGFKAYPVPGASSGVFTALEYNYENLPVHVRKNNLGLTAAGQTIVNAMMDAGMLVEIGHTSEKAVDSIYALSQANHNYPLIASHGLPRRMLYDTPEKATVAGKEYAYAGWELELSDATLDKIRTTDGIVGHFVGPHPAPTYAPSGVANNCQRSTRSLAQLVAYTVDRGVKVAWAGDFMGQASGVAPRLGYSNNAGDWCGGDAGQQDAQGPAQDPHLDHYATTPDKDRAYFATRGLGHFGLLRHFHDDLKAVGLPERVLGEFRDNGAENYIRTWEKSFYIANLYGDPLPPFDLLCASEPGVVHCHWEDTSVGATGFSFTLTELGSGHVLASGTVPYSVVVSHDFDLSSYAGGTVRVQVRTVKGSQTSATVSHDVSVPPSTCGNGTLDPGEVCDFTATLGARCGDLTCRVLRTCEQCQLITEECSCE